MSWALLGSEMYAACERLVDEEFSAAEPNDDELAELIAMPELATAEWKEVLPQWSRRWRRRLLPAACS